jgi:hypothetical protein
VLTTIAALLELGNFDETDTTYSAFPAAFQRIMAFCAVKARLDFLKAPLCGLAFVQDLQEWEISLWLVLQPHKGSLLATLPGAVCFAGAAAATFFTGETKAFFGAVATTAGAFT